MKTTQKSLCQFNDTPYVGTVITLNVQMQLYYRSGTEHFIDKTIIKLRLKITKFNILIFCNFSTWFLICFNIGMYIVRCNASSIMTLRDIFYIHTAKSNLRRVVTKYRCHRINKKYYVTVHWKSVHTVPVSIVYSTIILQIVQ